MIKYNHLIANLLIFHYCLTITLTLKELETEGMRLTPELLGALIPYRTHQINRCSACTNYGSGTRAPVDLLNRIAGEKKATPAVTAMDPNINTAPDSPAMLRMASVVWGAHGGRQPRGWRVLAILSALMGFASISTEPLPARHAGDGPGAPRGRGHGG